MDLDKSIKLIMDVLASLKLSKAEHQQLDEAMANIIKATKPTLPEGM